MLGQPAQITTILCAIFPFYAPPAQPLPLHHHHPLTIHNMIRIYIITLLLMLIRESFGMAAFLSAAIRTI
jgi:hypothetical protein